jgi:hypothetical protein
MPHRFTRCSTTTPLRCMRRAIAASTTLWERLNCRFTYYIAVPSHTQLLSLTIFVAMNLSKLMGLAVQTAVICCLVVASGAHALLRSQTTRPPSPAERPDLFAWLQDSTIVYRVIGGDTVDANLFAPYYKYQMVSDSLCRTTYTFTEMKRNGSLVKLMHWQNFRSVHADARYLTFNSRTVNFKALPGDTLSFYRELSWINANTSAQLINNYHSLDTLDFGVYLVRVSNGDPIALLDSIGVMPRVTVGSPIIYGTRPVYALVKYVVPSGAGLGNDSVFVGVTVSARGLGQYHFIRNDGVSIGMSQTLLNPYYQNLLTLYGSVMAKRPVDELAQAEKSVGSLTVTTRRESPHDLLIHFTAPEDDGASAVAVYDAGGNVVFYPFFGSVSGSTSTSFHVDNNGVYFVALIHRGTIVETRKIIINH